MNKIAFYTGYMDVIEKEAGPIQMAKSYAKHMGNANVNKLREALEKIKAVTGRYVPPPVLTQAGADVANAEDMQKLVRYGTGAGVVAAGAGIAQATKGKKKDKDK